MLSKSFLSWNTSAFSISSLLVLAFLRPFSRFSKKSLDLSLFHLKISISIRSLSKWCLFSFSKFLAWDFNFIPVTLIYHGMSEYKDPDSVWFIGVFPSLPPPNIEFLFTLFRLMLTEECFFFGIWTGVCSSDSESMESSVIVLGFLLFGLLPTPTLVCSLLRGTSFIGFK